MIVQPILDVLAGRYVNNGVARPKNDGQIFV